jgi:hypothetical protein
MNLAKPRIDIGFAIHAAPAARACPVQDRLQRRGAF